MPAAMLSPTVDAGPCGWQPTFACDTATFDQLDPAVQDVLTGYAAELLWRRTGRQYGTCDVTVRPCRDDCPAATGGPWTPVRVAGVWTNVGGCGCQGACGCGGPVQEVTLPGPVMGVTQVVVDGQDVDLAVLRVDNEATLVRQDGEPWPTCQHMGDPAPGGWQITYQRGRPLPPAGRFALGTLVAELAKACEGQPCRLPRTATAINRQGVQVTLPQVESLAETGDWGLMEVDRWVASVQPGVLYGQPPRSPDIPVMRRQTWP